MFAAAALGALSGLAALAPAASAQDKRAAAAASDTQGRLAQALDAVIAMDSQGWMMNRYDRGSVVNAQLLDASSDGKSGVFYGEYTYNGGRRGWVKVRMSGGEVQCVEYWDFQGRCRPIGRSTSYDVLRGMMSN